MIKITNLGQVKNVTSLEELASYDIIIRKTCKRVVNPIDFDDIVNDTYIKLDMYLKRGTIINGGYILLCMKSINLNLIKSNKSNQHLDITANIERIEDEYNEDYFNEVDYKIEEINDFLNTFLTPEEIYLYQYYKVNKSKLTAIFFSKKETSIKYQMKKIYKKIRDAGGFPNYLG